MMSELLRRHAPAACATSAATLRLMQRGIVLLLCLALGLQWTLLQGIAWTGMLIGFAREGSVIEAVEKTFDGQHPCPLCCAIKKGRHSEKKEPRQADFKLKVDLALSAAERVILTPPAPTLSSLPDFPHGTMRRARPPRPPPRCVGHSYSLS